MPPPSGSLRRARPFLGTIVEITLGGIDDERIAAAAFDAAFGAVETVHLRMSFHESDSVLSQLNRDAAAGPVEVDEWTFRVLTAAAELHQVSRGIFDVAVAPQLQALGHLPAIFPTPPAETVPSFRDVELLPDFRVRFHHPGVCLDLGGIAKGFAVDRVVEALQSHGVASGLVNAGGDLRAFGDRPFPISLRHPSAPGTTFLTLALKEASLATSAHYFAGHTIIHPLTGWPATSVRSATVRARNAMLADGLTKVVMVSGEEALPVLEHFGADALLIASGEEAVCTPGWHAAFEFSS